MHTFWAAILAVSGALSVRARQPQGLPTTAVRRSSFSAVGSLSAVLVEEDSLLILMEKFFIRICVLSQGKYCCEFCCAPLNHDEAEVYARSGGVTGRCYMNDEFCTESRIGKRWKECAVGRAYAAEKVKLDEYVRVNFQEIVNPSNELRYLWPSAPELVEQAVFVNRPVSTNVGRL